MNPTVAIIFLSLMSFVTTAIGVALAFRFKKSEKGMVLGIGFAVGIMLFISFLELIPVAISGVGVARIMIATSIGMLVLALFDAIIPHTHLFKEEGLIRGKLIKGAYLMVFGLILHDFPEGFAMANSYLISPSMGLLVALGIAIHNIPEEFMMTMPLVITGKKKLLIKAAILSALAEPAGALIGLSAAKTFSNASPYLMAFAAGAMIYVCFSELLPMATKYGRNRLLLLGIISGTILYTILHIIIGG